MTDDYDHELHIEQFGTETTCCQTLKYFIDETSDCLTALLIQINERNSEKAICIIKNIKEGAKLVGATTIFDLAHEIEEVVHSSEIDIATISKITILCNRITIKNQRLHRIYDVLKRKQDRKHN